VLADSILSLQGGCMSVDDRGAALLE